MDRKTAILHSANEHFACHGYRGASLRDIARDAQVSLTLLNHHFGSKLDLLRAVIHAHRAVLEECVARSRELLRPGMLPMGVTPVVGAWLDVMLASAQDKDGRHFLRLLARMIDDPQAEAAALVRDLVEAAATVMMDAICMAWPQASRRRAAIAYLCVSTAMLKAATSAERIEELETMGTVPAEAPPAAVPPAPPAAGEPDGADGASPVAAPEAPPVVHRPPERELLLRFLVGGIEALVEA